MVLRAIRNKFLAGLVVLVPIVVTAKALSWLFTTVDGLAGSLAEQLFGRPIPGVGFVATLLVVFVTGVLFSRGPLKRLLLVAEAALDAVPFVGSIYGSIKKVLQGFANPDSPSAFQRFVLARMPGRTAPGFLTGTFTLERPDGTSERLATIYVPTNHLYVGDIIVLPLADVIETELSVEDGVSLILSAGASVPARVAQKKG